MIPVSLTFFSQTNQLTRWLKFTLVLFALWISIAFAVQPIKVQGSEFINSVTNQRFQVIGVAYDCYIPGSSHLY